MKNIMRKIFRSILILGLCLGMIGGITRIVQAGAATAPGVERAGGTISGQVTCLGLIRESTDEIFVSLFDDWASDPPPTPIDTHHIACGATYQFDSLLDGTYYLVAFLDENGSGDGPPNPGEPWSGEPDPIVIDATNPSYTDIDVELARYIERVSLFHDELEERDWDSTDPAISGDGRYVVFYARGEFYTNRGVHIHDRWLDETHRFSTNDYIGGFYAPDISADGKYVAVTYHKTGEGEPSVARLLVKEWAAEPEKIIVIEPIMGDNPYFSSPSISGDGCRVAFEFKYEDSSAKHVNDVYLYDCDVDDTYLISEAFNGTDPGDDFSFGPAISDDGNFVAFYSKATDLVDEALTGKYRIYVRDVSDLANPVTELIPLPEGYDENVGQPSISADGRYVAYSYGDSFIHIFVYDRQEGVTKMVSPVDIEPESPSISADGRYVAFSGWIYEDTTWFVDIYVHDLHTGQTKLVTRGFEDTSEDENAGAPKISADGRFVAFWSEDAELVVDDENESRDVFVYVNEPALNIEIIGAGTVSKMPNESTFDFDTVVVLTPIAGANAVFDGWTGLDVGELIDNGDGTWSITMDTDKVITANFLSSGHTLFLPMIVR